MVLDEMISECVQHESYFKPSIGGSLNGHLVPEVEGEYCPVCKVVFVQVHCM